MVLHSPIDLVKNAELSKRAENTAGKGEILDWSKFKQIADDIFKVHFK